MPTEEAGICGGYSVKGVPSGREGSEPDAAEDWAEDSGAVGEASGE